MVWKFKDLVDDVLSISDQQIKTSGTENLPTFLGGQSMGGLIQVRSEVKVLIGNASTFHQLLPLPTHVHTESVNTQTYYSHTHKHKYTHAQTHSGVRSTAQPAKVCWPDPTLRCNRC